MKKKFLSLLMFVCVALGSLVGCVLPGGDSTSTSTPEKVDYAANLKLDMDSASQKIEIIPTKENGDKNFVHIDGDTTHFKVSYAIDSSGTIKGRYMGVDTPESTGDIEVWGKAASRFTKTKLSEASSIIIESDEDQWTKDSNERYLVWVWYKPQDGTDYRLLNLELLQEGLAVENRTAGSRYDAMCSVAAEQARLMKLYVYSQDKDPDFYYGSALVRTLKEVRSNLDEYVGKRVSVNGTISMYAGKGSVYIEEYVEEDGRSYGLPVFYGYNNTSYDPLLSAGNEVRIVGEVTYSEQFGYQICNLTYERMNPDNPENIKVFSKNNPIAFPEATVDEFVADNFQFAKDWLYGTVTMKNLYVKSVKTQSSGDQQGALTLTCEDEDGTEIEVHTNVLRDSEGNVIKGDVYKNKTIDVKGIVEIYYDDYQIDVFAARHITIHE